MNPNLTDALSMMTGGSYNVFNGEEHLLHSLRTMRPLLDYINIVVQFVSNVGNPASSLLFDVLDQARKERLYDEQLNYIPNFSITPAQNEFIKRSIGFEQAKSKDITYFMTLDCDEYYVESEFLDAKDYIKHEGINVSAAPTYLHIKRPIWRSREPDPTCVNFLTRVWPDSSMRFNDFFPSCALTDPTRRLNGSVEPFYLFPAKSLAMRHMNLVRYSLDSKLSNSSNAQNIDFMNKVRASYDNWCFGKDLCFPNKPPLEIIEVADLFNIDKHFSNIFM